MTEPEIRNPTVRFLVANLHRLPAFRAEQKQKREERREFCRKVWEQACLDAGLIKQRARPSETPQKSPDEK